MRFLFWRHKATFSTQEVLLAFLALVLAIAAVLGVTRATARPQEPLAANVGTEAQLVINFGNGVRREFRSSVTPRMTAADVLAVAADAGGMPVSWQPTQAGLAVAAIDGKTSGPSQQWTCLVNGRVVGNPAAVPVQANDTVEWRYQ